MARQTSTADIKKVRRKRKGIHSKNGTSKIKSSRNYKKPYRGQGKQPSIMSKNSTQALIEQAKIFNSSLKHNSKKKKKNNPKSRNH